jgi:hypothetical protein
MTDYNPIWAALPRLRSYGYSFAELQQVTSAILARAF